MTTAVPVTTTISFGATPTDEATLVITGLTDMTASAHIECWLQADDTTAGNNADAHDALTYCALMPTAKARIAGTGFTAQLRLWAGFATGDFKLHYVYII